MATVIPVLAVIVAVSFFGVLGSLVLMICDMASHADDAMDGDPRRECEKDRLEPDPAIDADGNYVPEILVRTTGGSVFRLRVEQETRDAFRWSSGSLGVDDTGTGGGDE